MVIDRFRYEDRDAIDALYRRVFGPDAAEASRLRWDWQYRLNPQNPGTDPLIWIAREGPSIIGQYATMPVALSVKGKDVVGSWGMDVMVAPERQRQGLGELLFNTWDRHVGASLGLGLSPSSHRLFKKMRWPEVGPVPYLVKPLTRRAFRRAEWPMVLNRLVSAVTLPYVKFVARQKPLSGEVRLIRRFDASFDRLWARLAPRFDVAVRRDAAYLQWKFVSPPHVRYMIAALYREGEAQGYVVYRHAREPRGKVTLLVDFLVDPDDPDALVSLLRWVDREARAEDSDKIRGFCQHAGFRKILKAEGYAQAASSLQFVIKLNALAPPADFYTKTDQWHVTLGDSDQDR
jgi:GNAT superfamily N-acetyltransferase